MIDDHFDHNRLHSLIADSCVFTKPKGILLAGPSGSGKTFVAKMLMQAMPSTCKTFVITCADMVNKEVGASEALLRDTFHKAAEGGQPAAVLLDDLDLILPVQHTQDGSQSRMMSSLLATLLVLLDKASVASTSGKRCRGRCVCPGGGLILLATATSPQHLDPALVSAGRLEEVVALPLPSAAARSKFLQRYLTAAAGTSSGMLEDLVRRTDGWAFSELSALWSRAALEMSDLGAAGTPQEVLTQALAIVTDGHGHGH